MSHFGLYNFALISLVASAYAVGTSDLPSGYHSVSASLGLPVHFSVTRPFFWALWLALQTCHIPTTAQTTTPSLPDTRLVTVDNHTYFSALITHLISKSLRMYNPIAYGWGWEIFLLLLCHLSPPSYRGAVSTCWSNYHSWGWGLGGKHRKTITMLMLEATPIRPTPGFWRSLSQREAWIYIHSENTRGEVKDKWDIQYPLFTFLIYNELFLLNWQETSCAYSCRVWKRTATERNSFLKYYLLHVSIKNQHCLKQWTKFKLSFSSITMCMIWNIYNEKPQQSKPLPISQPWCWIKNWKHYPNAKNTAQNTNRLD